MRTSSERRLSGENTLAVTLIINALFRAWTAFAVLSSLCLAAENASLVGSWMSLWSIPSFACKNLKAPAFRSSKAIFSGLWRVDEHATRFALSFFSFCWVNVGNLTGRSFDWGLSDWRHSKVLCARLQRKQFLHVQVVLPCPGFKHLKHNFFSLANWIRDAVVVYVGQSLLRWSWLQKPQVGLQELLLFTALKPIACFACWGCWPARFGFERGLSWI